LGKADYNEIAYEVRKLIINMTYNAGNIGTHIGGSLSAVEILVALYAGVMNINCGNLASEARDRFILSKGHAAMCQFAVMKQVGILTEDDIATFKLNGSQFHTHPGINPKKGIEFSAGSLGQGLSLAVGTALALRLKKNFTSHVYVLLGDGECDEGAVWEAAMSATHYKLANLTAIVDINHLQSDDYTDRVMSLGNLKQKFDGFGWKTFECNGHSVDELFSALLMEQREQPYVILANTIKGKGVSFMENVASWHNNRLSKSQYERAMSEVCKI
jgi:transketolase